MIKTYADQMLGIERDRAAAATFGDVTKIEEFANFVISTSREISVTGNRQQLLSSPWILRGVFNQAVDALVVDTKDVYGAYALSRLVVPNARGLIIAEDGFSHPISTSTRAHLHWSMHSMASTPEDLGSFENVNPVIFDLGGVAVRFQPDLISSAGEVIHKFDPLPSIVPRGEALRAQ